MVVKGFRFLVVVLCCVWSVELVAQVSISRNGEFRMLKGNEASNLSSQWNQKGFDDQSWTLGNSPFWFGDGAGGTELIDMRYNYSCVFLRTEMDVLNAGAIEKLHFEIDFDDGFVIWINGQKVLAVNAPEDLSHTSLATELHESGFMEYYSVDLDGGVLLEGENVLAIQALNITLGESSDFHFNMALSGRPELPAFPDTIPPVFSHTSGFYEEGFQLDLLSKTEFSSLKYTLDGSNPSESESARLLDVNEFIWIHPDSVALRGATPGVVVRFIQEKEGYAPSIPRSLTFLFPEEVLVQDFPGYDWPDYDVNEQLIDYQVDQGLTMSNAYYYRMENALTAIPSLSIVMDNADLFDASTGIYVNAWGHGEAWEKACNVELFDADSVHFQTSAGLRIRGGWSRHNEFPKHSFRLFFRSEYGDAKLDFPLFQEEGVDRFDKIDLRTAQNYAWSNGDSRNTMLREIFSRDLQREMGQPYTRSRYYHLYLNGMYWGIYQTQERSEARYAESYFGGDKEDYDVIKVNTENWNYQVEATDGNLELWQEVYDLSENGFSNMSSYYLLEGRTNEGELSRELDRLVDVDNLIDYMIGIFYTGNFDAPTSSFGNNNGCNNYYAIKDRTDPTMGFMFFNHDAEHSLFSDYSWPGIGIMEDRVNLATRTDDKKMEMNWFGSFHPQWLHYKLTDNAEYRQRFIDRAYSYFREGGLFIPANARAIFDRRMLEIDEAIVAESVRWGDVKNENSFNRDYHWVNEVNKVRNDFFPQRYSIVIDQLKDGGLYTELLPPEFELNGNYTTKPIHFFNDLIEIGIHNPGSAGSVYYTLNGTDPRDKGGALSVSALRAESNEGFTVSHSTEVNARVKYGDQWSAVHRIKVLVNNENYQHLKVSEIHYNPVDSIIGGDTIPSKSFEFIELKNMGEFGIHLNGLSLDSAISYEFPENVVLEAGDFYVIASKPKRFFQRYGMYASGNGKGNLSNGGERILLLDKDDNELLSFRYEVKYPWNAFANGLGYSLVPVQESKEDIASSLYWTNSVQTGGSPFSDDEATIPLAVPEMEQLKMSIYPNPSQRFVAIQLEGPHRGAEFKIDILSMSGAMLHSQICMPDERIDLAALSLKSGMYLMQVSMNGHKEILKLIYSKID